MDPGSATATHGPKKKTYRKVLHSEYADCYPCSRLESIHRRAHVVKQIQFSSAIVVKLRVTVLRHFLSANEYIIREDQEISALQ